MPARCDFPARAIEGRAVARFAPSAGPQAPEPVAAREKALG